MPTAAGYQTRLQNSVRGQVQASAELKSFTFEWQLLPGEKGNQYANVQVCTASPDHSSVGASRRHVRQDG
eukprot:CAMPEP_0202111120 /NCGR_PEP_ID=MMETSP0965-20130614/28323_1 /ASSEMBLY_ACC=CAM_ASM_000507 /TAXON_ID=4773 /ORGANISM="Schizochytrium aggregatum, Strain ATCC28209" /LENGTH=69 /DNA_ID=CAMNT_0048680587 /DNA_START=35 /DNA_END=241 /DNA_ORIENTATION=-